MEESKTICMNDDVLTEILEKLPPIPLFRFKSVSPEWRDLISSPTFLRSYPAAHRRSTGGLVAFFQQARADDEERCNTLPVCNKLENYIHVPKHVGRFVDSSIGLILCSRFNRPGLAFTYHVGNPLTGRFVELPSSPLLGKGCLEVQQFGEDDDLRPRINTVRLICEGTTEDPVPVYTVLQVGMCERIIGREANKICIDSYSSKTGEWSPATELVSAGRIDLFAKPPVVANGIVDWYTYEGLAVYDPNDGDRLMQRIRIPYNNKYVTWCVTRSADDDVLWLALMDREEKLLFYMLPKDGGYKRPGGTVIDAKEWVLMHEASMLVKGKKTVLECLIPESMFCSNAMFFSFSFSRRRNLERKSKQL